MSPERTFRVCILGAGDVVRYVHLPAAIAHPRLELAGIATRSAARAVVLAGQTRHPVYTDWRLALLECSPDIVVVAVPNRFHADVVAAALDRGCHVLVEKPAVVRPSDGWRLAAIARQRGLVLMTNMTLRFLASTRAFIAACQSALDMPKVRISMRYHVSRPSPAWYFDPPAYGGGIVANVALHPIDLAVVLGGMPFSSLEFAAMPPDETGSAPAVQILGRAACGLEFSAEVSWQADSLDATFLARDHGSAVELTLCGNRWSLRCDNQSVRSGSVWDDMTKNTALSQLVRALDDFPAHSCAFGEHLSLLEALNPFEA